MAKLCVCRIEAHFHWNTDAYTGSSTKRLKCFTARRPAKKFLAKIRKEFGPDDNERYHAFCKASKTGHLNLTYPRKNKKKPTSVKQRRARRIDDKIPF